MSQVTPKYPFYTLIKNNSRREVDTVLAYLSPFCTIRVELFEGSERIEVEQEYSGQNQPPKWEPTAAYNWKEELCSKKEFMAGYKKVQDRLKAVLLSPPTMNRRDAFNAKLDAQFASLSALPF